MLTMSEIHPLSIGLGIGDTITALGLALAIQQFLKPIYLFRLRAYGLSLTGCFLLIFFSFVCAVIAAVLPNFFSEERTMLEQPIVWEGLGVILIGIGYGVLAWIALRPARIHDFNVSSFLRAGANLLAEANDEDRVSFADDLSYNLQKIIEYTKPLDDAEWHATHIEFERLREAGLPQSIRGRPPISAFYLFTHRKKLQRASLASTFLRLLSDPRFCAVLVSRCPWLTASMLHGLGRQKFLSDHAKSFVQEIGRQAVTNENSLMEQEIRYEGFASAPELSQSLFSNWRILRQYQPLQKLQLYFPQTGVEGYISRFNSASEMMLETVIKNKSYWEVWCLLDVHHAYESMFRQISFKRAKNEENAFPLEATWGIRKLYTAMPEALKGMDERTQKLFFKTSNEHSQPHLISCVAETVFESLEAISNHFSDFNDVAWHHAIDVFMAIYPSGENEPVGLNAFQQRLAIMLVNKLKENMDGWYPALSRVLLAVIGPYDKRSKATTRTAFRILEEAVYKELQKLPDLYEKKPEKFMDFLPDNVTYDHASKALTHKYRGGNTIQTDLSNLSLIEVDFFDASIWRTETSSP